MTSPRSSRLAFLLAVVAAIGVVSYARGPAGADEPRLPTVAEALAETRTLVEVEGDSIGYSGSMGRFFRLSRVLLEDPEETGWKALLDDPSPVARAMGLFLLVEARGAGAVPDLRAHVFDRDRFDEYPAGCCGWTVSLGGFARSLLGNRHHLRYGKSPESLGDAETLLRTDLEILAEDRAANLHSDVGATVGGAVEAGRLSLTWPSLRKAGGGLSDVALAKAVGRMNLTLAKRRPFLLASLADEALGPLVRLAAASALTRDVDPGDAAIAIQKARDDLDSAAGSPVADRLLALLATRGELEARWAAVRDTQKAGPPEAHRIALLRALSTSSPLAVPAVSWTIPGEIDRIPELRTARIDALVRIAAGLPAPATWDTYGSAPFLLEVLATPPWGQQGPRDEERQPLRRADRERLLLALKPHLPAR